MRTGPMHPPTPPAPELRGFISAGYPPQARMADGLLAVTATHQTGTALQMLAVLSPLLLTLCPARVAIYPDAVPAGAPARVLRHRACCP